MLNNELLRELTEFEVLSVSGGTHSPPANPQPGVIYFENCGNGQSSGCPIGFDGGKGISWGCAAEAGFGTLLTVAAITGVAALAGATVGTIAAGPGGTVPGTVIGSAVGIAISVSNAVPIFNARADACMGY